MKVRLAVIYNQEAQTGFSAITKAAMPVKLSYAVAKNLKKFESKLDDIEKKRLDLVNKYGKADDKGGIQVTPENMEVFNKDFSDYLLQEVELDMWQISMSQLIAANVQLTPRQIVAMEDFIVDDSPKAEAVTGPATL